MVNSCGDVFNPTYLWWFLGWFIFLCTTNYTYSHYYVMWYGTVMHLPSNAYGRSIHGFCHYLYTILYSNVTNLRCTRTKFIHYRHLYTIHMSICYTTLIFTHLNRSEPPNRPHQRRLLSSSQSSPLLGARLFRLHRLGGARSMDPFEIKVKSYWITYIPLHKIMP